MRKSKIGENIIGQTIGLKWLMLPNKVQGLPIFNFNIIINNCRMYADTDNKWAMVYEIEEQGVLE
jgi:hypothetical protein